MTKRPTSAVSTSEPSPEAAPLPAAPGCTATPSAEAASPVPTTGAAASASDPSLTGGSAPDPAKSEPPASSSRRRPFPADALRGHPAGREVRRLVLILLASSIYAFNIKTFVRTANLIPGGINGISLLTQQITKLLWGFEPPFSVLIWTLNILPIYLGFRFIGKKFTCYSLVAVLVTGALTDLFPALPVTSDPLLAAVFGGLTNGAAASLCLFADASGGGMDIVSMYLSKIHGYDAWNIILAGNAVLLTIAGLVLGWEHALYSIIFQFTTTQVLHALHKRYQHHTLLIITEKPEEVYRVLHTITHHNATRFRGEGCYKGAPRTMLYSVVSSEEVKKVIREVRALDPEAFINSIRTENISGRFYRRPTD